MAVDQHPPNDNETIPSPTVVIKEEKTEDQPPINQHPQNHDQINEQSEATHAPTVVINQEESQRIKIQRNRNTLYVPYRNLRCDIDGCSILFGWHQDFECHMADIHNINRPYQCPQCDKTYARRHDLFQHVERKHLKITYYKCQECGKQFYNKGRWIAHRRIHTGERPYKCDTCCQSFKQFGNLCVHKRTHTGEKPHECVHCKKRFSQSGSRNKHQKKCKKKK
eukprot:701368_1